MHANELGGAGETLIKTPHSATRGTQMWPWHPQPAGGLSGSIPEGSPTPGEQFDTPTRLCFPGKPSCLLQVLKAGRRERECDRIQKQSLFLPGGIALQWWGKRGAQLGKPLHEASALIRKTRATTKQEGCVSFSSDARIPGHQLFVFVHQVFSPVQARCSFSSQRHLPSRA